MPRTSIKLAAAVLAAGLAVSACGSLRLGAAAITGNDRITTGTLTAQVANLHSAYSADQAKGLKPQRPQSQAAQQVLTWLILFDVYNKMAAQHGITVSLADQQKAQAAYEAEAKSQNLSVDEYWSAGGALPPDLLPQLYQAAAIDGALANKIDGGKAPKTSAGQTAVSSTLSHYQCVAAKSLGITVNPQYGAFDYNGFDVVLTPPTLAADPTPSPSPTVRLTPPC